MIERYLEAGYALFVAGLAYIWPPLALLGAFLYLATLAFIHDRRSVTPTTEEPTP